MIKEAKFPEIKTVDLVKVKAVDLKLKKADYHGKIKVVNNLFEGSLKY